MKLIIEPGPHSIAAARLVRRRSPLSRLDGWPWLLLHAVAYAVAVNPSVEGVLESFSLPIILATSVAAHVLCILGQFWSVSWFFLVRFEAATSLADADSVFVEPLPHAGSTEIVPLLRQAPTGDAQVLSAGAKAGAPQPPLSGAWLGVAQLAFSYQSCLYDVIPCGDALTVSRLVLPDACPLGAYQAWQGWRAHECEAAAAKWGANSIVMPSPTFAELMAEAVLAPLFVFQIACVLLWALDDYWYYSLFSLFTLFSLEAVMVGSRMKQRSGLRAMRPPPSSTLVFRDGRWATASSESLVPGDVISVACAPHDPAPPPPPPPPVNGTRALVPRAPPAAAAEGTVCPADVLLLRGSAVVNEAMLTGESAPQTKEDVQDAVDSGSGGGSAGGERHLDAFLVEGSRGHSRHVVFGGTRVIQHFAADDAAAGPSACGLPLPPDGGATAVVLRTGVYSTQGELMRTIMRSTDRVTAGNREAFFFIMGLLVFAVASSCYVMYNGWGDARRNRWKLLLHCIMIITSVVPPELPIELSLAVNSSVATLMRVGIFCTEPWRITLAGQVDVACFDKTGTITADEFNVDGIVGLLGAGAAVGAAGEEPTAVLIHPSRVPAATRQVLAGCHALMPLQQRAAGAAASGAVSVVGDPMERSAFIAAGAIFLSDGSVSVLTPADASRRVSASTNLLRVIKRWPFSSALKRMSCAIDVAASTTPARQRMGEGGWHGAMDALGAGAGVRIVCKGAPEALGPLLSTVPPAYASAYASLSATGARVLALAYRVLPASASASKVRAWSREEAEQGLTFVGFLVLSSPLKTDSRRTVRELQLSRHRVVMITGDAPLTAVAVAHQVGILKPAAAPAVDADAAVAAAPPATSHVVLVLEVDPTRLPQQQSALRWRVVEMPYASDARRAEALVAAVDAINAAASQGHADGRDGGNEAAGTFIPAVPPLFLPAVEGTAALASVPLCVSGAALQELINGGFLAAVDELCDRAAVFARVNPDHKERVIVNINARAGPGGRPHLTLMCGDGTNDVSALKQAHVGVSIISNPALEKRIDALRLKQQHAHRTRVREQVGKLVATGRFSQASAERFLRVNEVVDATADDELGALLSAERVTEAPPPGPAAIMPAPAASASGAPTKLSLQESLARRMAELERESAAGGDAGGLAMVSLGDASIASPFTSKQPSPAACLDILRQGRCTLVTTLQMYKILAINSLVLSYTLSVLYMNGVKNGDYQATASGMSVATFFLCISWAKPLRRLSSKRPHTSVFHKSLLLSVLGQFLIHLATIAYAVSLATPYAHVDAVLAEAAKVVAARLPTPTPVPVEPSLWGSLSGEESAAPAPDIFTAEQATSAIEKILSGGSVDDVVNIVLSTGTGAYADAASAAPLQSLSPETELQQASPTPPLFEVTTPAAVNVGGALEIPKLSQRVAASTGAPPGAPPAAPKPTLLEDAKFHPNVINTVVFLVSVAMQACTFLVNYEGAPFMEPLTPRSGIVLLTLATYGVSVLGALGLSRELSAALQLIVLPTAALRYTLASVIVANGVACVALERLVRRLADHE